MGRLSLFLTFFMLFISVEAFSTSEKENEQRDSLRLSTLQNELKKEEIQLNIQKEELTFYMATGESEDRIEELKKNILAIEDNITFLKAEIQNAKGEKPSAIRGKKPAEVTPQSVNRNLWWDVYSRDTIIQ